MGAVTAALCGCGEQPQPEPTAALPSLPRSAARPTAPLQCMSFQARSRSAAFFGWSFPSGLGGRSVGCPGWEVGSAGLGQGNRTSPPCSVCAGAHLPRRQSADHGSLPPPPAAVMCMCSVHKCITLCSCQPRLIGLMFPEEQPKAALAAAV